MTATIIEREWRSDRRLGEPERRQRLWQLDEAGGFRGDKKMFD